VQEGRRLVIRRPSSPYHISAVVSEPKNGERHEPAGPATNGTDRPGPLLSMRSSSSPEPSDAFRYTPSTPLGDAV
jgi:hypothetical protein